jgi:transcriptional regulator with XRE-family HTH domain
MTDHLTILTQLFAAADLRQSDVAEKLGYKSASAIGMMLRGERQIARADLERLCNLAGTTIIGLAELSDDLKLSNRSESIEGAAILDSLPESEFQAAMAVLRAFRVKTTGSAA